MYIGGAVALKGMGLLAGETGYFKSGKVYSYVADIAWSDIGGEAPRVPCGLADTFLHEAGHGLQRRALVAAGVLEGVDPNVVNVNTFFNGELDETGHAQAGLMA